MEILILIFVAFVLFAIFKLKAGSPNTQEKKPIVKQKTLEPYATVRFQYQDANGSQTERTVDVITGKKGDTFKAFCHLRGEQRTFYFDRIINFEVIDVQSGEVMTPMEWRYKLQGTKVAKIELEKEQKLIAAQSE